MTFEDLESWQKARQTTRAIYALTRKAYLSRDFGLCGQLQRAGTSVMSNIAEGFERHHLSEKLQFYNVARGSNAEATGVTNRSLVVGLAFEKGINSFERSERGGAFTSLCHRGQFSRERSVSGGASRRNC